MRMRGRSVPRSLIAVALIAAAAFVGLTVIVTTNRSLAFDARAFAIASDLRAPWLTTAARVITTLGLIAVVGPVLLLGAALLLARGLGPRAAALASGGALSWAGVWIAETFFAVAG